MNRVLLIILALHIGGCDALITGAMIYAPNRGEGVQKPSLAGALRMNGVDREIFIEVGPPAARLRVWVIEPSDRAATAGKRPSANEKPEDRSLTVAAPTGTLLLLHGYRGSVAWIKGMGRRFAKAGYRVVLVDLRGHGRSSGDYITYGVVESRDVSQVIDHLEREGLVAGKVGVWGISMGGATAIQAAARDPRIAAVVSVAPYTSMRDAVPHIVRTLLPVYGWLLSDESIRARVDEAGEKAGFNPDEADTLTAIRRVNVPTLIVHGKSDWIIPCEHGQRLHNANPERCELVELGWTGHITAHFSGAVARESAEWFDKWLR